MIIPQLVLAFVQATDPSQSPAPVGGSTGIIIALLAGGGVSAVVAAAVTGLFSKRKLGAEATEIITNAAAGVVTSMQQQLTNSDTARQADQAKHDKQMDAMAAAHVKERAAWQRVLELHAAWDHIAIAKLNELGFTDLPPTPPLTPAQRFVDDNGYPL